MSSDYFTIQEQKVKEILKNPNLLIEILKEASKKIVGEEDNILILTNIISLRLVKNAQATSSNLLVSDRSGGGKDHLVKNVCDLLLRGEVDYFHRTELSPKALNYWEKPTEIDPDESWNGKVLYLSDPPKESLALDAFRTMASGGNALTTVDINRKIQHTKIEGKPVIIVTSLNSTIDEEGIRRWASIRVDTSSELTKAIAEYQIKIAQGYEYEYDFNFQKAFQYLEPVKVAIPDAGKVLEIFRDDLSVRTILNRLLDYIKASAALHQKQREVDADGFIVANDFDIAYGLYVFLTLNNGNSQPLNIYEQRILKALEGTTRTKPEKASIIKNQIGCGKNRTYDLLEGLVDKGLIKTVQYPDNLSNREITHYYVDPVVCGCLVDPVVCGCFAVDPPKTNNQKAPNPSEKDGIFKLVVCNISYVYREINKQRKKLGLSPLYIHTWGRPNNHPKIS